MHKNHYGHQIKPKWVECFSVVSMCIKLKQMSIELKKKKKRVKTNQYEIEIKRNLEEVQILNVVDRVFKTN